MPPDRHTLLEFIPQGTSVRVNAVDSATGVEVSIQGPASAGPAALERVAVAKLAYVLGRSGQDRGDRRASRQSTTGWTA